VPHEECAEIGGRLARNFVTIRSADLGKTIDDTRHERRFVSLAPVRHRSEKRAVGFNQQTIGRCELRDVVEVRCLREREDSRQGQKEAEVQRPACPLHAAGEAVKHARDVVAIAGEGRKRIVVGLARMDHHRSPESPSRRQLFNEHGLLDVTRREVVVIVEADLSNCDHVARPEGFAQEAIGAARLPVAFLGLMRVDADREPDRWPGAAYACGAARFPFVPGSEDAHGGLEPCLFRPRDDRFEITLEDVVSQVAMGVNH